MAKIVLAVSGGVDSMALLDLVRPVSNYSSGDIIPNSAETGAEDVSAPVEPINCTEPSNFKVEPEPSLLSSRTEPGAGSLLAEAGQPPKEMKVVVAHFDHGIRENSAEDAAFVAWAAQAAGLELRLGEAKLGASASEAEARAARYGFLRSIVAELNHEAAENATSGSSTKPAGGGATEGETLDSAEIWTAHHLDDLVETVAINLLRGTGWRGLAALDAPGVRRPFLEPELLAGAASQAAGAGYWSDVAAPWDKARIWRYAGERNLHFREDQTNSSDEYLRNRIRHGMNNLSWETPDWPDEGQQKTAGSTSGGEPKKNERRMSYGQKKRLWELWRRQKALRREIEQIVAELLPGVGEPWPRAWFRDLERQAKSSRAKQRAAALELLRTVALELLRAGTLRAGIGATRPQLEEFRQAILNYAPGKYFNLPGNHLVRIDKHEFWL